MGANVGSDFNPPYVLGGGLAVVVGFLKHRPPLPASVTSEGWAPVAVLGQTLAIVIASHYDDPPPTQPRYDEAIVGILLRRGLRFATLPLTMQVSEQLPVTEGQEYYSLPKTLDSGLRLTIAERLCIAGDGLRVEAEPLPLWLARLLCVPCASFALGVRLVTSLVPDLGLARVPHKWVIVALKPTGMGNPVSVRAVDLPQGPFRALWGQTFARCSTWLGPPHDLTTAAPSAFHAS